MASTPSSADVNIISPRRNMSDQTPAYHFVQDSLLAEPAKHGRSEPSVPFRKAGESAVLDLTSDDPINRDNLASHRDVAAASKTTSVASAIEPEINLEAEDELTHETTDVTLAPKDIAQTKAIDTDDTISISSEESDDNMSIPHGELYDENHPRDAVEGDLDLPLGSGSPPTSVPSSHETSSNTASATAMPAEVKEKLEAWYAKHGRYLPPCASTALPDKLYSRNASGEMAFFVHKSGVRLQACMYPIDNVQLRKGEWPKQRIIVVTGPSRGPYIIRFTTQQNSALIGSGYKIWLGVNGGDKDGFESQASVYKQYPSTGKVHAKVKPKVKKAINPKPIVGGLGFKGNQFYHADGTPKRDVKRRHPTSGQTLTAANSSEAYSSEKTRSNYDFRPAKRQKHAEESPADYTKLLAAFSTHGDPTSGRVRAMPVPGDQTTGRATGRNQGELEDHIRNNAVCLFYAKDSPQPRARLFSTCNSVEKLFAQAIAGDVFQEGTKAAKVLSVRIGGQQKAVGIVETDEEDFENLVQALMQASHWIPSKNGYQGSCTVEVRSKS